MELMLADSERSRLAAEDENRLLRAKLEAAREDSAQFAKAAIEGRERIADYIAKQIGRGISIFGHHDVPEPERPKPPSIQTTAQLARQHVTQAEHAFFDELSRIERAH